MLSIIPSLLLTLLWVALSVYLLINSRKVFYLKDVTPVVPQPEPSVAIIIAVKDEEAEIQAALDRVCKLDYSNFRVIVINDRSTDRTPEILNKMTEANPSLSIITIKEVPKGWLGKNNALYQGYKAASEEWLLFTDADILYDPLALKRAMNYTLSKQLDHLTLLAQITTRSKLLKSVLNTFAIMLDVKLKPWEVSDPSSKASMGVGAFNLVKRSAYEKAGTHAVISLRPDDDLKLGERIKTAGLKQDVVYGDKQVSLEWYTSLKEFINGLMKNMYSVSNYHLPTAIGTAIGTFLVLVLPVPFLLLSGTSGQIMAAVVVAAQMAIMLFKRGIQGKWWHALVIPFAGLIMIYIIFKSAFKTIRQGGIYWRDSFYALAELKTQK